MKEWENMKQIRIDHINRQNEKAFYDLAADYLPGSNPDKMLPYALRFPKAFLALMLEDQVIGVAYGWLRKPEFQDDDSFALDGIAIRCEYQKKGYGRTLLTAFESSAREYGATEVSLGSAGGYVEKFYMDCGYLPREYKVWKNGITVVEKTFHSIEEYASYEQRPSDGVVVMYKRLSVC